MDLDARIDLVARTWTPTQQLHPGNIAWHGSGCDGAPPADINLQGEGWFAELWLQDGAPAEVDGHFSPGLAPDDRRAAFEQIRTVAPQGTISLVSDAPMADTVRAHDAREVGGPFFLLQHRDLDRIPQPILPSGYAIVSANTAGEHVRVDAHRQAWAPARIKGLLGLTVTGNEPPSGFTLEKYRAMKTVGMYRCELDVVVCAPDGSPAAFALGWFDDRSKSVLFEPVGTSPDHARRGLCRAVCSAVMSAARNLGATQSVVGPRGDEAYPAPRRLYESLGFTTLARTTTLTWGAN